MIAGVLVSTFHAVTCLREFLLIIFCFWSEDNIQIMLIKNIETVDRVRQAKHKLYSVTKLINISYESVNPIYLLIVHLIIIFPYISVLFATPGLFPASISAVLRIFLLTNLITGFGISASIVTIVVLVFVVLVVLLTIMHFVFSSVFTFCTKLLSLMLKIFEYFLVPLINFSAYCLVQAGDPSQTTGGKVLNGITFIFINLSVLVVLVALKFEIRMLRKKNSVWNLSNDIHVYALGYITFKTYFISLNGTLISICLLSLAVAYFLLQTDGGCINRVERRIERATYYGIAATDLAVLTSLLLNNEYFGLYVWMLALGSVIVFIGVEFYLRRKERIFLPPCDSPPELFYNFYYNFKEEFKSDDINAGNKKNYKNIFNLHRIHCRAQPCLLPPSAALANSDEAIEEQVGQLIAARRNDTLGRRLLHELWRLELGHKCEVQCLVDKPLTFKQDYILYSIERLTKDSEATMKSSQSSKNVISKVFYDLIFEISSHYSAFYEELARTHPKIDSIVALGISIRKKVERLKEVYSQLLKTRLINFKMIELYLEFFTNFVNEDVMDRESVNRLMKVQQHMHFEDIAENYIPTLTLYPDTGNIENANSEAQKFLQCTRFELKYRNISDLLFPSITVEGLKELLVRPEGQPEDQPVYSFLKKSEGQYTCGRLTAQQRYIKQKKLFVVQVVKEPFSTLKNMFLVNEDFQIELMLHTESKIKLAQFRKDPLIIQWADFFNKYILDQKQKLLRTKMAKVNTDFKGCLIIVKKVSCVSSAQHLLLAQIIISNESKDRKESILQNRRSFQVKKEVSKFEFQYSEDDSGERIQVFGYKNPLHAHSHHTRTLENFQREQSAAATIKKERYGNDIKTYRLYDGDLYNVDLEDREGYNDLFEEHVNVAKKKEVSEQSSLECYIFLAVIMLGLALIAFSVALIIQFQADTAVVGSYFSRYQSIESFNIDFQRIIAILRDQYSGLAALYPSFNASAEITQSYSRIQTLKNVSIFDNTEYSMSFQNLTMVGSLSELVDVILAHVTEVMYTGNLNIVTDILSACVGQLSDMISSNQDVILAQISASIESISFLKGVTLYSSMGIILLLYFFMVLYCVKSNFKAKEKLTDLMYISDSEARMLQDNAEKMKYAVEMARKNFDVDTQNLLATGSDFKKRKNPKEAILSRQIVYTIGGITILGLLIHLTCLFFFSQQFVAQISNFTTLQAQGIAIESLLSESSELATEIYYNKRLNPAKLAEIRSQLNYVEHQINDLLFTPDLTAFLSALYFENSCSQLKAIHNISSSTCANTCPGFTVVNPFQIGVGLYLHRQNYYMSNNLTENFAHTGVFSQPFARIFTNLTQSIEEQGLSSLQDAFTMVALLNGFIILIDCCYIFAFVIIYNYFRTQFLQIKEILYFFNAKWRPHKPDEQPHPEHSDTESDPDEEPQDRPKSRKRKTTIDNQVND